MATSKVSSDAQLTPIQSFYADRSVLVTGITTFLGKVIVERLLSSCPTLKKIYVPLKTAKGQTLQAQLQKVLSAKLYDGLPNKRELLAKVVALQADISQPDLGLHEDDLRLVLANVTVVIHADQTEKLDEPLRKALVVNVIGTRNVLNLVKRLNGVAAVVHVSTAFSKCINSENDERIYPLNVSPKGVINMIELMSEKNINKVKEAILEDWPNTYVYSKAVAEVLVSEERDDLPLAIMRPSIVGPVSKSGWVDTLQNGITGITYLLGMGYLRTFSVRKEVQFDSVPADYASNAAITAAWYVAGKKSGDFQVVNVVSKKNPLKLSEFFKMNLAIIDESPPMKAVRPTVQYDRLEEKSAPRYRMEKLLFHTVIAYLYDLMLMMIMKKPKWVPLTNKMHKLQDQAEWFSSRDFHTSDRNMQLMLDCMSRKDQDTFECDIRRLSYKKWFEASWKSLRRNICKEEDKTINSAVLRNKTLYFAFVAQKVVLGLAILLFAYYIIPVRAIINYTIWSGLSFVQRVDLLQDV